MRDDIRRFVKDFSGEVGQLQLGPGGGFRRLSGCLRVVLRSLLIPGRGRLRRLKCGLGLGLIFEGV